MFGIVSIRNAKVRIDIWLEWTLNINFAYQTISFRRFQSSGSIFETLHFLNRLQLNCRGLSHQAFPKMSNLRRNQSNWYDSVPRDLSSNDQPDGSPKFMQGLINIFHFLATQQNIASQNQSDTENMRDRYIILVRIWPLAFQKFIMKYFVFL